MDTTTRRRTLTLVAGIALAGLVAGGGIASAQGEQAATAPAAAADAAHAGHGTSSTGGEAATAVPAAPAGSDVCAESDLPAHTGFQAGPACVSLPFGEVGAPEDNPQLLITDAPGEVAVGEAFSIQVSTRNLVRDRFLPAAEGGYYVEPSTLDENGIVRGHFHTACRVLDGSGLAPQPERQTVFVANEDGGGGATPDTVTVQIPGLPAAGEAQCATWAGDGSHRMPMMAFANQVPAFDAVRITVQGAGDEEPAAEPEEPAGEQSDAGQDGEEQQDAGQQTPAEEPAEAPAAEESADAEATDADGQDSGEQDSGERDSGEQDSGEQGADERTGS